MTLTAEFAGRRVAGPRGQLRQLDGGPGCGRGQAAAGHPEDRPLQQHGAHGRQGLTFSARAHACAVVADT